MDPAQVGNVLGGLGRFVEDVEIVYNAFTFCLKIGFFLGFAVVNSVILSKGNYKGLIYFSLYGMVVKAVIDKVILQCKIWVVRKAMKRTFMQLLDLGLGNAMGDLRQSFIDNGMEWALPPVDPRELFAPNGLALDDTPVYGDDTETVHSASGFWDAQDARTEVKYDDVEPENLLFERGMHIFHHGSETGETADHILAMDRVSNATNDNAREQDLQGFDEPGINDWNGPPNPEFWNMGAINNFDLQSGNELIDDDYSCLSDLFEDDHYTNGFYLDSIFDPGYKPQMFIEISEKNERRRNYREKAKTKKINENVSRSQKKKMEKSLLRRAIDYIDNKYQGKKKKVPKQKVVEEIDMNYLDLQSGCESPIEMLRNIIASKMVDSDKYDSEYVLKAVEDIVLLVTSLTMCTSKAHMLVVVCQFLSSRLDRSLVVTVSNFCKELLNTDDLDLQAGDINDVKTASDIWNLIRTSSFTSKTVKLISLLISIVMCKASGLSFTISGFTKYFQMASKQIKTGETLISYVFDFVIFFIEKAIALFSTGDIMSVFYDDNQAAEYHEEYSFLISKTIAVEAGLLHTLGITFHEYTLRLISCEESTKKYLFAAKTDSDRNIYSSKLTVLRRLHESLKVAYKIMPSRIKPLGIFLFGESGVGKSNLRNIISHSVASNNPEFFTPGPDYIVSYNAGDKYMSEIKSFHQILIIDDIANATPMYSDTNITQIIIAVLNNEPRAVIKASVEEKGAIYMNFNLVVGTGNAKHMNSLAMSNEPTSILRRFEFHVEVLVKPEFAQAKGKGIDSSKTKTLLDSVWLFNVTRCYKNSDGAVDYEPYMHAGKMMCGIDIDELLQFLSVFSRKYYAQQTQLLEEQKGIFKLKNCEHGSLVGICKLCLDLQDGDEVEETDYKEYKDSSRYMVIGALPNKFYTAVSLHKLSRYCSSMPLIGKTVNAISTVSMWSTVLSVFVLTSVKPGNLIYHLIFGLFLYPLLNLGSLIMSIEYNIQRASKVPHLMVQKANKFVCDNKKIVMLAAGCGALYVLKNLYSLAAHARYDLQGAQVSLSVDEEKPNVWLKPEILNPPVDIKVKSMTLPQACNVVRETLCHVIFDDVKNSNALPICSNVYLVNWHILTRNFSKVRVIKHDPNTIGANFKQKFDKSSYVRIGQTDFALLYLSRGGTQKDIRHMFPEEHTKRPIAVHFIHKLRDGTLEEDQFNARPFMYVFNHPELDLHGRCVSLEYRMNRNTREGLCMSPLIAMGKTPYIAGLHSAGKTGTPCGVAQQLTRPEIEGALTELYENPTHTPFETTSMCSFDNVEAPGKKLTGTIHKKSAFCFQEGGSAQLFGAHSGPRRMFKSKVEPTLICDDVKEVFNVENAYGKPQYMSHYLPENEEAKAMLNTCQLDPDIYKLAHEDFCDYVESKLVHLEHLKHKVGLLDNVHNVSGINGVKFIDRINTKSSTGWPDNIPKKDIIQSYKELIGDVVDPITFPDEWWDKVNEAADVMAGGCRANFVNQANKKDEPKKLTSKKVRIFYGTPLVLLLLMRRYTLTIAKLIMDHWHMFETTIGINVASRDWERFVEFISKHGTDRLVAGDFEKFDTLMSADTILSCFKIIIMIALWSGNYDDYDIAVLKGIATEIAQPILEFFGDILMSSGNHISGHSLTIVINGFANSQYMRYAYYDIYNCKPPGKFADYVALMTNGDDNAQGVSVLAAKYNHTTIAASLAKCGINYTMADKESVSRPYLNISEVSYLKRVPTFSYKYGRHMPPLEKASIFKMLMNHIPSEDLTRTESAAETCNGALREIFFYGEEEFGKWRHNLSLIVDKHHLRPHLKNNDLVTFLECEEAYFEQY